MAQVRELITFIGENPDREGLLDTPKRVIQAMQEHFIGYTMDPAEELSRTFSEIEGYDQMVLLTGIDVHSHCEHHMVPFFGRAHVGYIPSGKVIGLSKIPRIIDMFSRRLQVQERLTQQILIALQALLETDNVAVSIHATHYCVKSRGVMDSNSETSTTALGGIFKTNVHTRAEFLHSRKS